MTAIRHFDLELADLKRSLVGMGNLVEQSLQTAVEAILVPSADARERVKASEEQLDALDIAIEDRCHRIMALQHPIAGDLRLLIAALHLTSDLEQMGDLAESICKRAAFIARNQAISHPKELETLANITREMVHEAVDAFITGNIEQAGRVMAHEKYADRLTKTASEWIQATMAEKPDQIREYTHLLRSIYHFEQITDIAAAIAQEAVYVHQGRSVRHLHGAPLTPEA